MDQILPYLEREERLKRNLEYLSFRLCRTDGTQPRGVWQRTRLPKAAVICWDLSHNPAGRAYVLAKLLSPHWDAELVGPIWPRFGRTLWEPLRGSGIAWRGLQVTNLLDLIVQAGAVSLTQRYDLVVVSKPRLPGLLLGLFLAEQSRCPLIFDFDEDERAFLQHHVEQPFEFSSKLLEEPFGTSGTLLAMQYWPFADAVTVASPTLRASFGGHLVRHARDETTSLLDRTAARQRLGYDADDLVLAFIGTVRAHKGLDRVVDAIESIGATRLKLMVVGSVPDAAMRARLARFPDNIRVFPPCDLSEVGSYLAAADLVPLLQDPESLIAKSQFPAKATDALQHGVPILAISTPPLADGSLGDAVDWIVPDGLSAYLSARLQGPPTQPDRRARIRRIFEDEYSDRVNRVRLGAAVMSASRTSNPFGQTHSEALRSLIDAVRRARNAVQPTKLAVPGIVSPQPRYYDVAFFWKQNDSGLFGRRADLVTKHLLGTGLIRRMVHFDHALHASDFTRMARDYLADRPDIAAMQFGQQALRTLRLLDSPSLSRRVFLTEATHNPPRFGGDSYCKAAQAPDRVAAALREAGCDPGRTIAWVCPVVWNFPEIAAHVPFHRVVVDLIDDQRTWARTVEERLRVHEMYERTLRQAHLVLTNAEGNRTNFAELRADIHVIPNGAELDQPPETTPLPDFLRERSRPVIGYSGNLSERIDWQLIQALAERRPDWDFVLIGPHGKLGPPTAVADLPNLTLPGPLPYDVVRRCFMAFDCAIVPHIPNAMTQSMNPLKVYNYLTAGLPVVSTPVANLDGVEHLITIAQGVDAFSDAISAALRPSRRRQLTAEDRAAIGWSNRMAAITELLHSLE